MTSNEAEEDDDSSSIMNATETGNEEHDLLIEKETKLAAEMYQDKLGDCCSKGSVNNHHITTSSKHLFGELFSLVKSNNNNSNTRDGSNNRQDCWKVVNGNSNSSSSFRKGVYNYLDLSGGVISDNPRGSSDDDYSLRYIRKGHKVFSSNRRKWRIFITLLLAFILIFTSIHLLIKLLILIQEHKALLAESTLLLPESLYIEEDQLNEGKSSRWLVSSPKCHIPIIDPWHESIRSFVDVKGNLDCSKIARKAGHPDAAISYVEDNKLFINDHERDSVPLGCCLRQVVRSEDNDDDLVYNETCELVNPQLASIGLEIPYELIKLECPKINYTNYHSFIVHDLEEEAAIQRVAEKKLIKDQYYNVVIVGMDTISRLNAYRQLNKTLQLLKDKFNMIEFYGYNKVGENTFPNLIPFLTGLTPEQLTETQCWLPSHYTQSSESGDDYLDNCKYLWNFYQEVGYFTYFSEDWPMASTFNYLKQGFKRKPTLFYGRPFSIARQDIRFPSNSNGCSSCILDKPIVEVDLENLKSFIKKQGKSAYLAFQWINCPQHDDLNGASRVDSIVRDFFQDIHKLTYDERTFVIFFSDHGYRWNDFVSTRVGHYESSLPLLTIAPPKHFIENHSDLYENLKKHQAALLTPFDLFKTIIEIRNLGVKPAQQALPKTGRSMGGKLGRSASDNHEKRKRKIVESASPVDNEYVFTSGPTATTTVKQVQPVDGLSYKQDFRVISLFNQANKSILDRSCIEAGIPDNYCVCHSFSRTKTSSPDVLGAAYYLVYVHLYHQLRGNENVCALLDLGKVVEAEMFDFKKMKGAKENSSSKNKREITTRLNNSNLSSDDALPDGFKPSSSRALQRTTSRPIPTTEIVINEHHYLPVREYNIRVQTEPGAGLFQEVVRFYSDNMAECKMAVKNTTLTLEDPLKNHLEKYYSVMRMNEVCKYSVHSDSISRLNLYKDQSKCVKNNIELKKICYCNNN